MAEESEVPARTYEKRGLPKSFASAYPHGLISGQSRSATAQKAFDTRKAFVLRNMTKEQIEAAYDETVKKILTQLEEDRKKNEEIEREMDLLNKQRALERALYSKHRAATGAEKDNGKAAKDELVKKEGD